MTGNHTNIALQAPDADADAAASVDEGTGTGAAAVARLHGIGEAQRNRLVIRLLLVATFVVILNETIMAVAIPPLMRVFHASAAAAQWLTGAFLLTSAIVIPVTGFLLQRFNTRPVFLWAMSLFSLGTLIAALAPDLSVLILARIIQALGTAIMMPLLMTTVMMLVPSESRGHTVGNISIVMSMAPAIGPTISGFILNYLPWRWMFLLVLPIALGALLLSAAHSERHHATPGTARCALGGAVGARFRRSGLRLE